MDLFDIRDGVFYMEFPLPEHWVSVCFMRD
jgi:hypothetical protein